MPISMSLKTWKEDLLYQEQLGSIQDDPDWAMKFPFHSHKGLWQRFRKILESLSESEQLIVFGVVAFYANDYKPSKDDSVGAPTIDPL
jgi:hypothetical protein